MVAKKDITTRADVELMVNTFYAKVRSDELIGPIFNDVAQVVWETHLPKMYSFWNSLIFGDASYRGHPFRAHVPLPVGASHFNRWLLLFELTIDELFSGDVATHTKLRAKSIAHIFQSKLAHLKTSST